MFTIRSVPTVRAVGVPVGVPVGVGVGVGVGVDVTVGVGAGGVVGTMVLVAGATAGFRYPVSAEQPKMKMVESVQMRILNVFFCMVPRCLFVISS